MRLYRILKKEQLMINLEKMIIKKALRVKIFMKLCLEERVKMVPKKLNL